MLRFHSPLIEPDVRVSRIRLSDKDSRVRGGEKETFYFCRFGCLQRERRLASNSSLFAATDHGHSPKTCRHDLRYELDLKRPAPTCQPSNAVRQKSKSEGRRQKADAGRQRSGDRSQRSELRRNQSGTGGNLATSIRGTVSRPALDFRCNWLHAKCLRRIPPVARGGAIRDDQQNPTPVFDSAFSVHVLCATEVATQIPPKTPA